VDLRRRIIFSLEKTYCRIKKSRLGGVGVFAIRGIPKGADPFPMVKKQEWAEINVSQMKRVHPEALKMVYDFFSVEKDGTAWVPEYALNGMDISFFLNHSERPNLKRLKSGNYRATRKVSKGEELFTDYRTFDPHFRL